MNGGAESLYIGAITHKAFVEVSEEGTEAEAAAGVAMRTLSAGPPTPVFRADHPFLFAVCDVRTGLILFMGRIVNPYR
jgi:serpin B